MILINKNLVPKDYFNDSLVRSRGILFPEKVDGPLRRRTVISNVTGSLMMSSLPMIHYISTYVP